jgi:hypothetical protein
VNLGTAVVTSKRQALQVMVKDNGQDPCPDTESGDCAVLNLYLKAQVQDPDEPRRFDSIRCGFVEGEPAFEGSGILKQSHVQLAVRNPTCVLGVFRPR